MFTATAATAAFTATATTTAATTAAGEHAALPHYVGCYTTQFYTVRELYTLNPVRKLRTTLLTFELDTRSIRLYLIVREPT